MSARIPRDVEDVLCELSVIANLPSGSKLNSETGTYAAADSYIDAAIRTFYRENVNKTIDHINNTISNAVSVSQVYPGWQEIICQSVVKLNNAINNLIYVYSKKPHSVERIRVILLRITEEAFNSACSAAPEKRITLTQSAPIAIPTSLDDKIKDEPALSFTPNSVK